MRPAWRVPAALLIASLGVTACTGSAPYGAKEPIHDSTRGDLGPAVLQVALDGDLIAGVTERETSPEADGLAVNAVVSGTNAFAIRFFQTAVGDSADNVVVGNYSLGTALLLAMAGTNGSTTDAFANLLGIDGVDPAELHPAVNAIDLILESRAGDGLDIRTANKIFVQQGLTLRDEFLDAAVGSYGAPVTAVDFLGSPAEVAATVNDWVSNQTDGFIDKLTDGYPQESRVVLANAMYLKAPWAVEFHRTEHPGRFTTSTGEVLEVEMMSHDEYLPVNNNTDVVAVELPYVGGNLGLVVIQPADLGEFEANLTADGLREITDGLEESGIHLTMPIWSTKTDLEALEHLHAIGLPDVYDFSTMIEGGQTGYSIESVSHVARIDVDETGTTAGAATDVVIEVSHGPTVEIDRPFFYLIRDRGSGAILFLGHVTDPTQTG